MIGLSLLDNSAFACFGHAVVEASPEVAEAVESGRIHVSVPFLLEAGYSARSGTDHSMLLDRLLSLPLVSSNKQVEARALDAQRQLARTGHHRLPPVDLLVGALADVHGLGVLHYDRDFDLILDQTDLTFESVWLAEPGSL